MEWSITVVSDSGNTYTIKPATAPGRTGLWCNCPAWRNMKQRSVEERVCKHIEYVTRQLAEQFARGAQI